MKTALLSILKEKKETPSYCTSSSKQCRIDQIVLLSDHAR